MALKLRIVSEHRRALGSRASVVFGVAGGSVGRAADNDWVLPDPSRYVSGRHLRVQFRQGQYYIEDLSTNGTYLNDESEPLPKRTPFEVKNGDLLRIGDYQIVAMLDAGASEAGGTADIEIEPARQAPGIDDTAPPRPAVQVTPISLVDAAPLQTQGDLGLSLNTDAIFGRETDDGALRVGNAFGQAVVVPFTGPRHAATAAPPPAPDNSDVIAARRLQRLHQAVAERSRVPGFGPGGPGVAAGASPQEARRALEAFCRGAGLDASRLPHDQTDALLQLAGLLLREAMVGLKDLAVSETEARHQFALGARPSDPGNGEFRLTAATDELLANLLASAASRRLDAGQWVRQSFATARGHQEGLSRAARQALVRFLGRIDPSELEERFERSGKRNLVGARPSNWELYKEFYRSLMESSGEGMLPHSYLEDFAGAYRAPADDGEKG